MRHLIFLTVGTGLGAGLIVNGQIVHGASDTAGEIGHWRLSRSGPEGFGKTGSWEAFSSGAGLVKLAASKFPQRWQPQTPIMTSAQYLKSSKADRLQYLFMRHPLTILFGYVFVFFYSMCVYPFFNSPREHYDCLIAMMVHLTLAVLLTLFFGWPALWLTLIIPHLIASAIGSYLFYAQHNFPGVSFYDRAGWAYEKAALESSSFLKTGPIMGWFTANIGYHHIHHLNARVPFYRLPEVLKAIPELAKPKTTSLHLLDIIRCLRLKVWDVEAQQMVGLPKA